MRMLRIVRHSLTEGNERRLYYGTTDLPLSGKGVALCLARRGDFPRDASTRLGHSGMLRARQTLQLVMGEGEAAAFPGLREMDMGAFEMLSYEDLKDDSAYNAWVFGHDEDTPIPGGESTRQVRERVAQAMAEILALSWQDLFIVAHGGSIAHAMGLLFPAEARSFYDWIPEALHGYAVELEGEAPLRWREI